MENKAEALDITEIADTDTTVCTTQQTDTGNAADRVNTAAVEDAADRVDSPDGADTAKTVDTAKTDEDIDKKLIRSDILSMAWPSVTEMLLIAMCDMINLMMVGKLGPYAISAVGLVNQPKFIMLSAFISLNVGATALVARFKGQGNAKEASTVLRQNLVLTIALSIVISIIGFTFARSMIVFMGAAADTIEPGTSYFRIMMCGFVFTAIPMCISSALRGAGNTKSTMQYNITANLINVSLNFLLIDGKLGFPALGVNGPAVAMVIGWMAASSMALFQVFRGNNFLSISLQDDFRPDFAVIKRFLKIGLPAAGEQLAMRVGMLIYTKTVTGLGTDVFATHQIATNIQSLSFTSGQAFGIAATSLVGQSLGKKRIDLAKVYAKETRRLGSLVATFMALVFFFLGGQLVSLYTNNPDIIRSGTMVLKLVAVLQPFQSSFMIYAGGLRGAGDTRSPALSIFVGILIIRPILAFFCVNVFQWGLIGAWIAFVLDQFMRFVLIRIQFLSDKWTALKV